MEMATCNICGKIFGASSGSICPACRKLLDIVYDKARTYLRDNPKKTPKPAELAEAIGENVRLVEVLMMEGRFDAGDSPREEDSETEKQRKRLLKDLEQNLAVPVAKKAPATTYGNDRHGRSDD
ncbi:MAG: hypothetical protein LBT08_04900 [Synergistaceae bacterium]|nr:hypothetical protein [Synergistaceae bacterium]